MYISKRNIVNKALGGSNPIALFSDIKDKGI